MEAKIKVLLISVGGSTRPIVYSILKNRPDRIIFFTSSGTYDLVTSGILPEVSKELGMIPPHEIVVTPDAQHVGESAFALLDEVPRALIKFGETELTWPELVDYTGGTKSMSAALVWASSGFPCRFSYIGSDSPEARSRGGVGIVLDGRERCFIRENPWDRVGYFEARAALTLFNRAQYANAASLMESLRDRVDEEKARFALELLAVIFNGFAAWDVFNHKKARSFLNDINLRNLKAVRESSKYLPSLKQFYREAETAAEILKGIKPGILSRNLIWDLLANARRRAEMEKKYEDACARCYAAIEKWGKYILKNEYGISNNDARPEHLPGSLRNEYVSRYTIRRELADETIRETISFGLGATFRLLDELGDNLGKRFRERRQVITEHLSARNESILAHGTVPATRDDYRELFSDALYLLDCAESDMVQFPHFDL